MDARVRRSGIIDRLERSARVAQDAAKRGVALSALDQRLFFDALADAGDFNRTHPDLRIPPLDRLSCKVTEPRIADTSPADRWRTA